MGDDVVAAEIPKIISQSLISLLMKGGHGGKKRVDCNTHKKDWEYFPSGKMTTTKILNVHSFEEREKRNKTAFTSIRYDLIDDETYEIESEIETKVTEHAYRLMSVKK